MTKTTANGATKSSPVPAFRSLGRAAEAWARAAGRPGGDVVSTAVA